MSTYLIVEFPDLDSGLKSYLDGRAIFSSRQSCLGRSETNPTVSYMIFKDDVDPIKYNEYRLLLPPTCKNQEIILN